MPPEHAIDLDFKTLIYLVKKSLYVFDPLLVKENLTTREGICY